MRQLAARAGGAPLAVPAETLQVLLAAREVCLHRRRLRRQRRRLPRWHFGDDAEGHALRIADAHWLAEQRRSVGWRRGARCEGAHRAAAQPQHGCRSGRHAKPPIPQAGTAETARSGVAAAMIDGGGDIGLPRQPAGRDWRVGIRDPRAPQRLAGVVALRDGVVASSGDYERSSTAPGGAGTTMLDPASGWPTQGVHGVALVARDIGAVNGLGAAIMVGGLQRGQRWLAQRPGVMR